MAVPDTLQTPPDVEAAVDDLDAETGDPAQLAEVLADLAANPLDINTASARDLALIPAFSSLLARRLVADRQTNGPFRSIAAIRRVAGVTPRRFLQARPYLVLETAAPDAAQASRYPTPPSLREVVRNLDVRVLQRAERRLDLGRGYDADTTRTTFAGSPLRLTTRIRVGSDRRVQARLTLDKDPGEPFRWAPETQTYGFDHLTGSLAVRDFGRLQSLVVGDFAVEFGQGVTLWRGIAFGKGRDPVGALLRSGRGVTPYASTEENRFFRGLAATVRVTPSLSVTGFASRRRVDASLGAPSPEAGSAGIRPAVSLSSTGLHRTDSEIARKDALRERVIGGAAEAEWTRLRIGAAAYHSRFGRPVARGSQPYERFDFAGDRATMASIYASAYVGNAVLSGEVARAPSGDLGGIVGAAVDVGTRTEAVVVGRMYPRSFTSRHGYAFGERNGATQNEMGLYTGLRLQVADDWTVAAYADTYRFPWLRFSVPRPSSGIDARLVVEHRPRPWMEHYVQVRAETREEGTTRSDGAVRLVDAVQPETRQSLRWHGEYVFSDALTLRTRIEASRFHTPEATSTGLLMYQDIRWSPVRRLQLDGRLAFFDTDDFDARVFAYEYDLLYAFSVPALFGQGRRAYLLARARPTHRLTVEAKYGVTTFADVDTVAPALCGSKVGRLG